MDQGSPNDQNALKEKLLKYCLSCKYLKSKPGARFNCVARSCVKPRAKKILQILGGCYDGKLA